MQTFRKIDHYSVTSTALAVKVKKGKQPPQIFMYEDYLNETTAEDCLVRCRADPECAFVVVVDQKSVVRRCLYYNNTRLDKYVIYAPIATLYIRETNLSK
jgi:hypothetical protein